MFGEPGAPPPAPDVVPLLPPATDPLPQSSPTLTAPDPVASEGDGRSIRLGRVVQEGAAFTVDLESLRRAHRHLRRLRLRQDRADPAPGRGVRAAGRLRRSCSTPTTTWPGSATRGREPPAGWGPGDDERARDYLDNTDVVVWTPRRRRRPAAQLPAAAGLRARPRRRRTSSTRPSIGGRGARAARGRRRDDPKAARRARRCCTEALQAYARRQPRRSARASSTFLAELPEDVSRMRRGRASSPAMLAETLRAAMVNDPLFGGEGTSADPGGTADPAARASAPGSR